MPLKAFGYSIQVQFSDGIIEQNISFLFHFIAVCIRDLSFITSPVLRAKLTTMIKASEYTVAFFGARIIQMIVFAFVSAAANRIHNATVNVVTGVETFPILIMR